MIMILLFALYVAASLAQNISLVTRVSRSFRVNTMRDIAWYVLLGIISVGGIFTLATFAREPGPFESNDYKIFWYAMWGIPTAINSAVLSLVIKHHGNMVVGPDCPKYLRVYLWMRGACYNTWITASILCVLPLAHLALDTAQAFW